MGDPAVLGDFPAPKPAARGLALPEGSRQFGLLARERAVRGDAIGGRGQPLRWCFSRPKPQGEIGRVGGGASLLIRSFRPWRFFRSTLATGWRFDGNREQKIELYDVVTAKSNQSLPIVSGRLAAGPASRAGGKIAPATMIFSSDGQWLAAYADPHTIAVWDLASGLRKAVFAAPYPFSVGGGAIAPDGRCLALDLADGSTIVYELATGTPRHVFGRDVGNGLSKQPPFARPDRPSVTGQEGRRVAFSRFGQTIAYAN